MCAVLLAGVVNPGAAVAQPTIPPIAFDTFTLTNGLRFIVHEDTSTPIVAVTVSYHVGGAHDGPGRAGFAHLFEHLMFQETELLAQGEFNALLLESGADRSGELSADRTMYWEVVPSNRVNLALWLEAERMARLRVTETNLRRERDVVRQEDRQRTAGSRYPPGWHTLDSLMTNYEPYLRGGSSDLDNATVEDVLSFHRLYYVPNNATVVLAGDITLERARMFAQEYFGAIPRGMDPPPLPPVSKSPRRDRQRRAVVQNPAGARRLLGVAFATQGAAHPDQPAVDLLVDLLVGGEWSLLTRRLVRERRVAMLLRSYQEARLHDRYFTLEIEPLPGVSLEQLEALLWDELDRLRREGVTETELAAAQRRALFRTVQRRETVLGKAYALQDALFFSGDAEAVNHEPERIAAATVADLSRVARAILSPGNSAVLRAQTSGEVRR